MYSETVNTLSATSVTSPAPSAPKQDEITTKLPPPTVSHPPHASSSKCSKLILINTPGQVFKRRHRQIKCCLSPRRVTLTSDVSQTNLAVFPHDQRAWKNNIFFSVRAKPCTALRNRFYLALGRLSRFQKSTQIVVGKYMICVLTCVSRLWCQSVLWKYNKTLYPLT